MSARPQLLQIGRLMPYLVDRLAERYTLLDLGGASDRADFLAAGAGRCRAAVTSTFLGLDAATIDLCPGLEFVASFGVGTDSLAVAHAAARGITVTNTPDVLNEDTANLAVLLLLACSRNLVANDRHVRAGRWAEGDPPLSRGLAGRTVGLVGMGRIGQVIARKLEAFGCVIAYHTRNARPELPYRHAPSLLALAAESAALIVIVPGGAGTRHLIDAEVMAALGPEGILVNVARGSVVDEDALVACLADGRLGFAGLDVYANEPEVPAALLAMEHVILQPHQGSATRETRQAMADLVVANLERFFAGAPPLTPVAHG